MNINQRDIDRLQAFINQTMTYLEDQYKQSTLPDGVPTDKKGFVVSSKEINLPEYVLDRQILDVDFKYFILENLYKFTKEMYQSADNNLFGFGERSLYEMITSWCFLFLHGDVNPKHTRRMSALILAGHYKYIDVDNVTYARHVEASGPYLKNKDKAQLDQDSNAGAFFDYVWDIIIGITNSYGRARTHSFLDTIPYREMLVHQHMRVHANPLSINETLSEIDKKNRHILLLGFYLRQVVDYLRISDPVKYEKLKYTYDKFVKNNKITD